MSDARSTFQAIGTSWEIHVADTPGEGVWQKTLQRVHDYIDSFDKAYSRFRDDSLVVAISRRAGTYGLPADGYDLLQFYQRLYRATNGKVTPLIGQLIADAGYDAAYSFKERSLAAPPTWDDVLDYNEKTITVRQRVLLDFGAAGKGYLIDKVGEILESAGIVEYVINAGGDIRHRSGAGKAIEIGLENPFDSTEAIGAVTLQNQSICASSGSKRAWGNYHHIFDPDTRASTKDVAGTWVIADDTMTADGLATALFFVGPEALKDFAFSAAVLDNQGSLSYARDFPVTVFEA